MRRYKKTPSTTSPKDDRRACLCPDGTYSRECCDGSLIAQGIGNVTGTAVTSEALTISSITIDQAGTITLPTATFQGTSFGTVGSVTPPSFQAVSTETTRTVTANVTVPAGYTNTGNVVTKEETATQPANTTVALSCSDITFSGFSISQAGVITLPSIDIGTIASTTPKSYDPVTTATSRTLNVNITVPSGYTNSGATLACTTTATQPIATLSNPVTTNPFKYVFTGFPSGIVTYRFAYNTAGDFVDLKGIRGELGKSLGVNISAFSKPEIVDGSNIGLIITGTEEPALVKVGAVMFNQGSALYFSSTAFTSQPTGSTDIAISLYTNNTGISGSDYGLFDSTNSVGIAVYTSSSLDGLLANIPVSDASVLNQKLANGFYTTNGNTKQFKIEEGVIQQVLDI